MTIALILINGFCFLAFNIILDPSYIFLLVQNNYLIMVEAEYWRLLTAMFLHADILHIFFNMMALLIFGAAVEENFYKYQYLLIYFISGFIGNIASLFLLPVNSISLGASGAIFGLIGAAFVVYIKENPSFLFLALLYMGYFIVSSFGPGINAIAHLFGLAGGLLLGLLFYKSRSSTDYY